MGHFEDLEDLGLKTSVSVLGIRPGPRSELKTLDMLTGADLKQSYNQHMVKDVELPRLFTVIIS